MYRKILISLITVSMLLLAACGGQPTVSSPPTTASSQPVSTDTAETAAGLYEGPYEGILPMSVPAISEADKETFNPDRVFDYLATSPFDCHDYTITGWEERDGKLYLTVGDQLYFDDPNDAYYYIKDAFALADDTLLSLPVFAQCHVEGVLLSPDSSLDLTGYEAKTFDSVPVAGDALISLPGEYDPDIDTVQKFIDAFVNGKYKDAGSIPLVSFSYEDGQITEINSLEEYQGEDGEEDNSGVNNSDGYPDETTSPHACGFGSLPKDLFRIKPVSAGSFDPDKAADYIIGAESEFEDCYWVDKAKLDNGRLYLYITDSVSIDADTAYQYLKTTFSLSDDDILALPMFAESDCALYDGKMYTPDGWDLKNGIMPEDFDSEYNYNGISLKDITLPNPVPVADNASIFLVDYGFYFTSESDNGCTVTTKQFEDYLLGESAEDNLDCLSNIWFKYSNNEITAIAEQYIP